MSELTFVPMNSLVNPRFNCRQSFLAVTASCSKRTGFPSLLRCSLALSLLFLLAQVHAAAASFSNTPALLVARSGQTATLLLDGKLLVTGGQTNFTLTSPAAEMYDPATGIWTVTGSMNGDRAHHTATMLPNGQVLVAGGYSSGTGALASAELYDPAVGTWTTTAPMSSQRFFHTATLLPNGQVLVVGGTADGNTAIPGVELYDPTAGTWTALDFLNSARFAHTATLLTNGHVLIAGGKSGIDALASSVELVTPVARAGTVTNSLTTPRYFHTATLLPNGQVLVAGGTTNGTTGIPNAELYDPTIGIWTPTNSLNLARFNHTATLLPNGTVLVTGGTPDAAISLTNAEVFDFNTGVWIITNSLNTARYSHTATLLANGEVLLAGGVNTKQILSSVERYNAATGAWQSTGSMTASQQYLTQILLANGKVMVLGSGALRAQLYDPVSGTWSATSPMTVARFTPSVTLLPSGRVLVAGGNIPGGAFLASAELYDPTFGTWTPTGPMHQVREYQTATLLPSGLVLVAGGINANRTSLATCELYNAATGAWTPTGSMNVARAAGIGTLLANGKVLVASGISGPTNLTSAELYDPGSGTWSLTGPVIVGGSSGAATLLPNGKVLFVGGYGNTGALATAQLYEPGAGTWSLTAPLPGPRYYPTAILLPNGRTLVAGGSDGRNASSLAFLYDAPTGSWQPTASLSTARAAHAASLLTNGKVLVAGGSGTVTLASAEVYDPDQAFRASWQPQIASVSLLSSAGSITIEGSGFRGISEGSGGNSQDSPADYPVVELMSLNSGLTLFLGATNWTAASLTTPPASSLPPGYLLTTVFVNGIPSQGQISKIPTPPVIANLPAGAIGTSSGTLNGQVLDTGGNSPAITFFYGTSDGGTNAAAWSNSITLGLQSGAFAQSVSGLLSNTTYYFTAQATNVAGISWAMPSQSFTTVTLPLVTNLSATRVQGTFATLNGDVLFTGHQTPSVTIYYGPTDGGANPNAWSNSVALGLQGGLFAQTVYFLSTDTTYFYTAQAVNVAGTNWAAPSQSFATAATNAPAPPGIAVLTQHNDNGRTGMSLNETVLNISNVNSSAFGLLYTRLVDDQVYAQPLVMTNVNILGKGTHNILIVATVNDTIYTYDADDPLVIAPYWTNSFINPPNIVAPNNADESAIGACGGNYLDYSGKFGIVGTPVIDPASDTLYVVARTKEFGTNFVQRLHALDLTTGLDRSNSPVVITATYPGVGAGSSGGIITFDPLRHNQRPALALVNGVVYISWSSHCDNPPYHGWVIGYDASTLQQVAVFNDTPNGAAGGIWMSGQGPSADDSGNIYLTVGNGTVDGTDYGESFLKLSPTNSGTRMNVSSYFIPLNWPTLNSTDADLGSAGLLLIPGTTLAISGGKQGLLYLVNRDSMGGISSGLQSWSVGGGQIHGGPVWWTGPNGSFMYIWADSGNRLRQYQFTNLFNTAAYAQGATGGGSGSDGGILSLSANGTNAGTAIIWATVNRTSDANQSVVAGTLHAYSAQNVGLELWNSDMVARDTLGNLAKFVPPTVANGKVYVATFSGRLNIYGLLPFAQLCPPSIGLEGITVSFAGSPGLTYSVQRASTLSGSWVTLATVTVADDGFGSYLDPNPPAAEAFYRVSYP